MGKVDYSCPIPAKSVKKRFGKIFDAFIKNQSATLLALPHTGRSSNLRYLAKNNNLDGDVVFFDVDRIGSTYESFVAEVFHAISGYESGSYGDTYLLNKELINLIAKKTSTRKLILFLTLKKQTLSYSADIDQLMVNCQKSATNFLFLILWSIDTEVFRSYKKIHPSSTFGENMSFFRTFSKDEAFHSLKRILLSKSINKKPESNFYEITGGIAGSFHGFINNPTKELWNEELTQQIFRDIKNEVGKNKNLIDELISTDAYEIVNQNTIEGFNYKNLKLSSSPTAQEINLLNLFFENSGPISRDDIAKILWGKVWNTKYSDWAIDKTISRLRKKLDKSEIQILTVKNFGYQIFK